MFNTIILTPDHIVYEGKANSVFLPGSEGEFEILEFHKPIISLLKEGSIIVDWKKEFPIRSGCVRMAGDKLIAVVEE